jgi:hypothetical protein
MTRAIAIGALVLSIGALAVALYAVAFDSSPEQQFCGDAGGGLQTCVGNSAPADAEARKCFPASRDEGITYWQCRR